MIQLVIYDKKNNVTIIENYSSKDEASERLAVVGCKPSADRPANKNALFILEGATYDTKSEGAIVKPYLFPELEEDSEC